MSSRPSTRLGVTPQQGGGYLRASTPDPNDAMALYQRGGAASLPMGAYASRALPSVNGSTPTVSGSGESALSTNLSRVQRGRESRQAFEAGEVARRAAAGNTGIAAQAPLSVMPHDARFEALLQALSERGTSGLSTGAAAFGDAPGFFDTQQGSSMGRLMGALRQQRGSR